MAGLSPAELLEKALNGESLDDDTAGEATTTTTTEGNPTDDAGAATDAAKAGAVDQGKATGGAGTTEDDEPKGAPIAASLALTRFPTRSWSKRATAPRLWKVKTSPCVHSWQS